jgi:hypothetical protein
MKNSVQKFHLQIVTGEKVCITGKTETTIKYLKVDLSLLMNLLLDIFALRKISKGKAKKIIMLIMWSKIPISK